MASGSISLSSSKAWAGEILWSSTTDIGGNYSNVYVKATMWKTDGYLTSSNNYTKGTITINGTTYSLTGYQEFRDEVTIFENTIRVGHNADGTKSISISLTCTGQAGTSLSSATLSGSGTALLDTIPRASTISVGNGTLGVEMTITINRPGLDFVHRLTYNVGDAYAGYIAGSDKSYATATSLKWTPSLEFARANPENLNVPVKLTLQSYTSSGQHVGTTEKTITCAIPDSVRPVCSLTVDDATGYDAIYGAPVQGLSMIHFKVTATESYGSPIAAYDVNVGGSSFHSSDEGTSSELLTSGSVEVTATVTDKRGRTGSDSRYLNVLAYAAPSVTALHVIRCDADGVENAQGNYVRINFSAIATSLSGRNSVRYSLKYKPTTEEQYTEVQLPDLDNVYIVDDYAYIFPAVDSSSFDAVVTAADNHRSTSRSTSASTAFTFMDWHPTGTGIAFGKVSEKERTMEIAMHAEIQGTLARLGNQYSAYVPEGNANADSTGFDLMARITVLGAYANAPLTFTCTRRGAMYPMTVHFRFQNVASLDPSIGFRTVEGENYGAYLVKSGASVWDLYVARGSEYDFITLQNWYTAQYMESRVSVTFPSGYRYSLTPDGLNVVQILPAMQPTLLDMVYPVNSIYISYSHTDPGMLFGGVWERIKYAFLLGVADGDEIGATGGEHEHYLTAEELPEHVHEFGYSTNNGASFSPAKAGKDGHYEGANYLGFSNSVSEFASYQVAVGLGGGNKPHNNMPPYIAVSVWRRIA